jgi:hypothetical protein
VRILSLSSLLSHLQESVTERLQHASKSSRWADDAVAAAANASANGVGGGSASSVTAIISSSGGGASSNTTNNSSSNQGGAGLGLRDYLIMPVQRVPRYEKIIVYLRSF